MCITYFKKKKLSLKSKYLIQTKLHRSREDDQIKNVGGFIYINFCS